MGEFVPSLNKALYVIGGEEYSTKKCSVLTHQAGEILFWKTCSDGNTPKNAVFSQWGDAIARTCTPLEEGTVVQRHSDKILKLLKDCKDPVLGRVYGPGSPHPGLHATYNGCEYCFKTYSVLCKFELPEAKDCSEASPSYWVTASGGAVPPNAVRGGTAPNGESVYVGRALHVNVNLVPGQIVPSAGNLFLCWSSAAHSYQQYEALVVDNQDGFHWVYSSKGEVPPNSVVGGEQIGENYYIGRTVTGSNISSGKTWRGRPINLPAKRAANTQLLGKVHCSHEVLYVPYDGLEYMYREYEVLVSKVRPKSLQRLCSDEILRATRGDLALINGLPLPPALKDFCKSITEQ